MEIVTRYIENWDHNGHHYPGEDEIEIEIGFDFQAYEPNTWDCPGCSASVDICEVKIVETGAKIEFLPEAREMMEEELLTDYEDSKRFGYALD